MRRCPGPKARKLTLICVDVELRMNAKTVMTELEKNGGRPYVVALWWLQDVSQRLCRSTSFSDPGVLRPGRLYAARRCPQQLSQQEGAQQNGGFP